VNRFIMALLATLALLAGVALGAQEPSIRVEASPKSQMSHFTTGVAPVTIRVYVPPSPQNRAVCVQVDGTVYRSSCWESHATDRLVKEFRYPSLPSGTYVVVGTLSWWDEKEGKAKTATSRDQFVITE
jgi:hypothetical protein